MKLIHLYSVAGLTALCAVAAGAQGIAEAKLTLDPTGATKVAPGYFPIQVKLADAKPAGIVKEPAYKATPKYATLKLGNGPKSTYLIAVDEPEGEDFKIYLDANRNGDLTDDGDGAWKAKREGNGRTMFGLNQYVLRASWGTDREVASGEYGLAFYRFTGQPYLLMYRQAARTGTITLDGKEHKIALAENDADALYTKPVDDDGKPVGGGTATRPVWLFIDLNDDGKFGAGEQVDARGPFKLDGKAYEATIAMDGSSLKLAPTTRVVKDPPAAAPRPPLLAAGIPAPDFAADGPAGPVRLSDFKGKTVILDFWATWCGPCQKSMPHLEKVYQAVKNQNVVVLAVCVWDEKGAYDQWIPEHKDQLHFNFVFDPAGRADTNIAKKLYNVSGIPTTYVIDKDGKIVGSVLGYSEGSKALEGVLKKAGLDVPDNLSASAK